MSDAQEQRQTQTQSIQISLASAGDVQLETEIFRKVSSVGRQLGAASAVLEVLLDASQDAPALANAAGAAPAIEHFRAIQAKIKQQKAEHELQRLGGDPARLIEMLDRLDPPEREQFRARLAVWVARTPGAVARQVDGAATAAT